MAEYPSEFEFDVLLRDGRAIHLRPIKPEDAPREHAFFKRVGPESVYRRFFQVKTDLTPEELRHFTNVDYVDRMAFVAIRGDDMVAVGRYDRHRMIGTVEDRPSEIVKAGVDQVERILCLFLDRGRT